MKKSARFRILSRSYVKPGRRGPWWLIATFRFSIDAQEYWDKIPVCWEARMFDGKDMVRAQAAIGNPCEYMGEK